MAEQAHIKKLNRLRGALKTKLTLFEKLLQNPPEEIDLIELKGKILESESLKLNFEEKQSELELLVSDSEINGQYEERSDFEGRLSAACARAQRILNEKQYVDQPITTFINSASRDSVSNFSIQNNASTSASGPIQSQIENYINIKLPALNLPSFSGSYEKWPSFSDTFKSSVHNDKRYTDSQKLIYLRSCLTGKAADKIESLETTDANYQVAWKILEKYYDDPTSVINNHIETFFELPNCSNASASSIGELLNIATKNYRALQALKKPFLETFPIYAITSKLDPQTRLKWKEHSQGNIPTMEELLEFLHCREKVLESNISITKNEKFDKNVSRNENQNRGNYSRPSHLNRPAFAYATVKAFCHVCKNSHFTQNCEKLLNANVSDRLDIIKNLNLCINCLRSNHSVENCNASLCKNCNKKHHTLLHRDYNSKPQAQVNLARLPNSAPSQFLLSTAVIHILDRKGNPHICRALLDNGSQVHFITEKMATKLELHQQEFEIPLGGVNQMSSSVNKITYTSIQSRINKYTAKLTFLITPEINQHAPSEPINRAKLNIPSNLHLADPKFYIPSEIDILIGAEIFLKLLCVGQISLANDSAILQKTHFGWILGGKLPSVQCSRIAICNLSMNLIQNRDSQFRKIENGPHEIILSNKENEFDEYKLKSTTRDPETELGKSDNRALKRSHSIKRSLYKKPYHNTEHNLADVVSRGLLPKEILSNMVWLHGPSLIKIQENDWPVSIIELEKNSEMKEVFVNLKHINENKNSNHENETTNTLFQNLGTFFKIIRGVAYCQRFINVKVHKKNIKGNLSSAELKEATICVIKLAQREAFLRELLILEARKQIEGSLAPLNPFLDSEGVLRVGGRLNLSDLLYCQKHPIILPKNHNLTNLVIREQHMKLLHAGTQTTLYSIRNNYWIVNGKNTVKNIIRKCIICFRAKPQFPTYIMGNLPKDRTVFERAFKHTGIDYCGPFFIKERKFRNRIKVKIYTAIFACLSTKAIHIEIVSDLTTEAFLACLKRFFVRRGMSSDLYSDNASNFKGAKREINELYTFLNKQENIEKISCELANQARINWHFIPPRSPHFGGLWEAAVKSFKYHFTRVIGERVLTYEEFTTFATEVEGILNSRPLTPIPSDPKDLIALTPGHFLIGDSITNVSEHNLMDTLPNRLSSWQQVQKIKQHFWARWNKEYLHELTVRKKWHKGATKDIQIGSLVTIRDDNLPPMRWRLDRIIALHSGSDKVVRVVTLKTAQGEYKRSIKNLSPLPIDVI